MLFHRVFQEAFLRDHRDSALVFLRRGWGVLLERIAAHFESRGGVVLRGARAECLAIEGQRVSGVRVLERPRERDEIAGGEPARATFHAADAVVVAVPAHALRPLLPSEWQDRAPFDVLPRLGGAPIVSVEMWLDRVVVDRPMVGLRDCEMEWVFDKGRLFGRPGAPQHLGFIVSAAHRSAARPNSELAAAAVAALRRYFPAMAEATVQRTLVLRDPLATFSSSPELEPLRPGPRTPIEGLFLAGDWTGTGLPATIEGAVRSGEAAAAAALDPGSLVAGSWTPRPARR